MTKQTVNLRYYEDEKGILEVAFFNKPNSPYFRFEIRYPNGTEVHDHNKTWLKSWYPQIWQDIRSDPLT